ncbi:MAG: hypothetical protein VCA55_04680, partial [Verrucomicrobiales bacterium]
GGPVEKMRTAVPVALASFLLTLIGRLMCWKYWFVSGVGAVLILVIIAEAGQFFLPQRNPNWGDVLRGAAGAVVGLVVGLCQCVTHVLNLECYLWFEPAPREPRRGREE